MLKQTGRPRKIPRAKTDEHEKLMERIHKIRSQENPPTWKEMSQEFGIKSSTMASEYCRWKQSKL